VGSDNIASDIPSPPATIRTSRPRTLLTLCAIISTPEELRTGPASSASSLIDVRRCAKRPAISNTEIGPAASSN
jgi:hypothetical protein